MPSFLRSGENRLRTAQVLLALLGLVVAGYLAWEKAHGRTPTCVIGGHACGTVQSSKWAVFLGVPLPYIGLGGYLTLMGAALLPGDRGRTLGMLAAIVGTAFSAWLTYLELFVIHAICPWCVASAVLMMLSLAVSGTRAWRYLGTVVDDDEVEGPEDEVGEEPALAPEPARAD